jgi:hypothetical protein
MSFPLTDAERLILQTRLDKAKAARHDLLTGQAIKRFVDQNGEQVEYSATNISALERYISELECKLSPAMNRYTRPRPIGFVF